MKQRIALLLLPAVIAAQACVPHDRYDAALKDAKAAHASADQLSADLGNARAEIDRLNAALKAAQDNVDARDKSLAQGEVDAHDLQTKLDDSTAQNEQLRIELERLGKNADALLAEKGTLASALAEAKARLEELRKAQAAADQRAALFRQLALKFQKMIDSGALKIKLRDGRMVIELSNDVLFDSGQTVVKPEGQKAIAQVAAVLRSIPDRRYQVAGHTDNIPIQSGRFHSNWDLSTARAVEVVKILIAQGLKPEIVSAAGYGEFDPVAPNDTPQNRAKNRRIEITLQPNIDELVAVPETK
ncbi:MAG TPA: OmpA family protein [Polyangiaceae bacterium]|nr:OmpA family protein [Polyangiaceae bacterium]